MNFSIQAGPQIIRSRQNARVKELRASLKRVAHTNDALIAIEGPHLFAEAVRSGLRLRTVFLRNDGHSLPEEKIPAGAEVIYLAPEVFRSAVTTSHPQGIAALAEVPRFETDDLFRGTPLLVLTAGIQDPGNLGTLVRSGEAFGATGIIRLPGTVDLWNSKTLRASSGSAFRLPVLSMGADEAFALLKQRGVRMFATVPHGGMSGGGLLQGPCALLLGNEGAGVPTDWIAQADEHITIPCPGEVESLNAAVAGSILLYEAAKQRKAVEHR